MRARRRKLKALVYVCGLMPPPGTASRQLTAGDPDMLFRRSREVSSDGLTYSFARTTLPAMFYEDVSAEDRYRAMSAQGVRKDSASPGELCGFSGVSGESGRILNPLRLPALLHGSRFDGIVGLRDRLVQHPEPFVTTLTENLLTYALGRNLEYYDNSVVRAVVHDAARDHYRISSLVLGIVKSTPFQMRRTTLEEPGAAAASRQQ